MTECSQYKIMNKMPFSLNSFIDKKGNYRYFYRKWRIVR